ncbi:MAG: redoxin family protein [Planctomycetota bacterium]
MSRLRFTTAYFLLIVFIAFNLPATSPNGIAMANESSIRQGPHQVAAAALGVGRQVPDFEFTDIDGNKGTLADLCRDNTVVIAMTGTGCPLCKKYSPVLAELEELYRNSVSFVFVNPNESEAVTRLQQEVSEKGFVGPYIRDDKEAITQLLDAKTTTEVFVIDRARTLVYRGAVDDQHGIGYSIETPRRKYLVDALDAVAVGELPEVSATWSPGCELFYRNDAPEKPAFEVTYHNRVSRIIQRNCLECHRDGGVAPMPLTNYEEVRDYAGMIANVVKREVMPPWFASESFRTDSTKETDLEDESLHPKLFANDRSLADSEREDLISWVKNRAPEGDPTDAPLPRKFVEGWLIGQPDDVFAFEQPIPIKATGVLDYKYITVETNVTEDKWVQEIEVVPGDRSVVHHVLVFVLPPKNRGRRNGIDYWGIYVPGNSTQRYPAGFARKLPKGSRIRFQMHYTTNGTATEDRTKVGVIYADEPPKYEVKTASLVNTEFRIPANSPDKMISASLPLQRDILVLGYLPHHHLRGVKCEYRLTPPDGGSDTLLSIPRYDFNWQLFYQYIEPRRIAKGSKIEYVAWYDNSSGNPANPNPNVDVRWGEQTDDEMHIGYIEYVEPISSERKAGVRPNNLLAQLDVNGDGELTMEEVKERMPSRWRFMQRTFDQLDRNKNGKLDGNEAAVLQRM